MSKIPALTAVRIIPRDTDFLDRRSGSRGEVFYDRTANTLRLYDGSTLAGVNLAKSDLTNVSNAAFVAKATAAGVVSGIGGEGSNFELTIAADDSTIRTITSGNVLQFTGSGGISTTSSEDGEVVISNTASSFTTIAVSGQSNIVADQINDILTFVAGSNVTITTDADTDTITISAAGGGGSASDSFSTIAVSGQNNIVADSATDTLTIAAGPGISITTDASTDTITITSTASATTFAALTDNASATIDQIYLPAITALTVTNNGASSYRFDQYGTDDNPTVYAINGTTIAFKLNVAGHPFLIQNGAGVNYNTGLIHVSTTGAVTTGASAQGKTSGTLYWKIPTAISGGYRYQCSIHAPMVGSIFVKVFSTL